MTDRRKGGETVRDTYGDPDSALFSHRVLAEEVEVYRRLLNAAIPAYVFGKARERIMKAAEEYAWARARERYAAIKEMPEWVLPREAE